MIDRDSALAMINNHSPKPHMVQHALASEVLMQALARHFNEDEALWGLTGLLHDLDYAATQDVPEAHGIVGASLLEGKLPEEAIYAIKAHNSEYTEVEPKSRLDYALRAAETVTGLILAASLLRPTRMEGMQVKSLKKKMKDKAFAASVSRDRIKECERAGLSLDEFLALSIEALTPCYS